MSYATLEAAIDGVQTAVGAVTGIKSAPANPPESAAEFPFVVTYTRGGTLLLNTHGDYRGLHNIVVELHIARKWLPEDVATALPFFELVSKKLFGNLKDNDEAYEEIPYTFGALTWGTTEDEEGNEVPVQTIGFTWELREVKVVTTFP